MYEIFEIQIQVEHGISQMLELEFIGCEKL
jgi:hypothetical protein